MTEAIYIKQINRRLACVEINGEVEGVYISTGTELPFMEGSLCYVREAERMTRETRYDLYSVSDGGTLVCVHAKEPAAVASAWLTERLWKEKQVEMDFYCDSRTSVLMGRLAPSQYMTVQVMGTSLLKDGIAYLPEKASNALNSRLGSLIGPRPGEIFRLLLVACRGDARAFQANDKADPYFADLLRRVNDSGVPIECLRCIVDREGMHPDQMIPVYGL